MNPDQIRLESLLVHLRDLERTIPSPHDRPILEVARAALVREIRILSRSLHATDYCRPVRRLAAG